MTHVIFVKLGRYRKRSILDVSSSISYTFYNLLTGKEMSCKNGVASRKLISRYIIICNEIFGIAISADLLEIVWVSTVRYGKLKEFSA